MMAFNAIGEALSEPGSLTAVLRSSELLAGVNEAVASMKVGEERILFIPPHLASQDPDLAGLAQAVVVKLIAIVE